MIADAHRLLAEVVGELSLCLVRGKGGRSQLRDWAARLRAVAATFEEASNVQT